MRELRNNEYNIFFINVTQKNKMEKYVQVF